MHADLSLVTLHLTRDPIQFFVPSRWESASSESFMDGGAGPVIFQVLSNAAPRVYKPTQARGA
jgi:hypothetical protein